MKNSVLIRKDKGMKTRRYGRSKIFALVSVFLVFTVILVCTACTGAGEVSEQKDGHLILNCTFDCLRTGESRKYYVRQSPAAAGYELVWESGDENVATVDKSGTVTAVGGGETDITVKAENTPYKARMKLTVADETVFKEEGESALQLAVDKLENNGSVLVIGGYYPYLTISGRVTITGMEGAAVGQIEVKDNAELFLYSASVYSPCQSERKACVTLGKGSRFTAVGCGFFYDDPTGETTSEYAVSAPLDAAGVYCRACSFSGYKDCVKIGATDGEIYLVNNDFNEAETAITIDLRISGTEEDKNAYGKVNDNVYIGCKECVKLYYNAISYTGPLEIADADVSVPS